MNKNVKNALIIAGVLSAVTAPSVKASEHMIIDSDTSVNQNFNDYSSNSPQYGGAIYQSGGSLNVEGGKFSGNVINGEGQTSVYGGAIGTTGGTLTIYDNVEFTGNSTNSAAASGGGALALQNGNQTTIGNDISFNNNSSYCGGAIYTATNDVIAGNNNTFSGNSAGFAGGAIYNGSSAAGTANMTIGSGTTISNNDAQYGGGIYNLGYGGKTSNVTIGSNSNISGNTASKDGGAIYNDIDSDKNISNIQINGGSTVSNNTASGNGGAVYNNGNFKLDTADGNITFSGNKANGSANDIYQAATGSTVITGDGNTITMDGGFAGSGTIDKTGSNTLVMNSDNSAYTGTFNQTAGKTTSKGKFFGGQNKITNSELELGDNSELVKDSTTDLESSGKITVSGNNVQINGEVKGQTGSEINKTAGSGTLDIDGSKGAKTDGFNGKFKQEGGTTNVKDTNLFANTEIKDGTVNLNTGANIASNGSIDLSGSGAILNNNGNNITFTNDSTISGAAGSQINNSGNLTVNGQNAASGFDGNYAQSSGTTTITDANMFSNSTINGGSVTIGTNGGISTNGSINLAGNNTSLTINSDAKDITFTADSTIAGSAASTVTNNNNVILNGTDTSGFNGKYIQNQGKTDVTNSTMFANSDIKSGTVNFNAGANIATNGNINLGTDAILNNTAANTNIIEFTANSTITGETGSKFNNDGKVSLNGTDTSGFKGKYTQDGNGNTDVQNSTLFADTEVKSGTVNLNEGANIASKGNINLSGSGATLNNNAVNNNTITFTADSTITGVEGSKFNNDGKVSLNGTDTSGFKGKYTQDGNGNTDVQNSTLFADIEVKSGKINLNEGANIASKGNINLSGSGATLNNNGNNITFTNDSTISGAAGSQINNSGNLTVNGQNAASGFNGDYNQNEGNTTIIDADMFANSTINGGSVTIGTNGGITADGYLNLAGENTSLTINSDAKDIAFTDNSILSGSATSSVINNGTISVDGHNAISGFNGKYVQNAGSISIDNADMFKDAAIAGGTVTIKTNGNLSDNSKLALNGESTQLNIEGTGNHQFNDVNITGNGQINNASSGELALKGDYSGFDGKYNQTAGLTTITGTDADNMSTMFKNVTIDGDGTELKLGNFSTLAEGGSVNITNKGTLTFAGEQILNNNTIIGSADSFVKKESSGKLTINNSDYSGFLGTYQQTDGLTLADHSAFFSKLDITGGELQLVNGSTLNSSAEQTDLSFGAKLTMEDSTAIFNGTGTNNFKEDVFLENSNLVIKEGAAFDKDVTLTSSIINIGTSEVEGAVKDAVFGGNLISNGTADAQSGILVNGNMSVAKNTQLYYTVMDVKGDALFSGTLDIKGEGSSTPGTEWHVAQLGVGGNLTVADDKASNMEYTYADIKGDAAFGGTTEVSNSQINVGGDSIFKKAFTAIDSFFDFKKNASFNDNVNIASTVENQASTMAVGGDLKVDGTTTLDNAVVKVGGNAIFGKDSSAPITARNAGDIDDLSNSVINIAGTGTFNNEVIAQNTTIKTGDDASFKETVLANDSLLIFDKNVTFDKEIKTSVSNLENNILTVGENLVANGKFDLNNTLANVGGDVTLNEASKFTGSVLDVAKNFTSTSGNVDLTDSRLTVMGQTTVENGDTTLTNSTLSLNGNADFKQNLTVGQDSVLKFLNPNSTFNVDGIFTVNNGTVDVMNNVLNNNIINNDMIIDGTSSFAIDIDPRGWKSDTFTMNGDIKNVGGAGAPDAYITISDFNLTSVPIDRHIYLPQLFQANGEIAENVKFLDSEMSKFTPIGWYQMQGAGIGNTNGYRLSLIKYNPQVFRGQVATVANYQNQLVTNNILFDHIQEVSLRYLAEESPNKYAASYPQFAPYQYDKKDGSLWFKAYGTLEKLGMSQGLNVENNFYGVLAGADFPVMKLKNGWSFLPTAYVGYNGAHQVFNKVGMTQNGGQGGFMGTFMKNDFIGSLLAYGGGYGNEMDVAGYTDTTGNWYAGTAAKAAYNFHPTKHFIIQPTALVSYNFFGNQNWHTNFGDMSMSSGYLNGVNVAPGLNLIYGRETWSIYGTIQYFYNIMGYSEGQAGNVGLPGIAMRHGFLEYGLGFTKTFKDRLSAYLQITLRNGGRTGVGFQGGLQYKL